MFEREYEMRYGDYKDFENLRVSALLDIIQDAAICHSASVGYGLYDMHKIGLAWMLQGMKLEFLSKPNPENKITAKTAICSLRGATSVRGTVLYQDGVPFLKAVVNWFMFDCVNSRPCRIPQEIADCFEIVDFEDDFFAYKKPELLETEPVNTILVSNKEIDTNLHLNNRKSSEILMDALPFDYDFDYMNVFFKKPAYLRDKLTLEATKTEKGYYTQLKNTDNEVCVAGVFEKFV